MGIIFLLGRNMPEMVSLNMVPIEELLSDEITGFIHKNRTGKIADIMLRMPAFKADGKWIAAQIEGWQKAMLKLPLWASNKRVVYPLRLSMEQCSSEKTAAYKASLYNGVSAIDLTGGFGVDSYFISKSFERFTYIEQQEELAEIAAHNFKVLGNNNISVRSGNSEEIIKNIPDTIDLIYLDPARRKELQKVFRLSDCEPNVVALQDDYFALTNTILVKASPMLDITEAIRQLKGVQEIHIISVDGECKEVLYLLKKEYTGEPLYICINDQKNALQRFTFLNSEESAHNASLSNPLHYIYEPNASILKAGGFNEVARQHKVFKLNVSTHLYTSEELIADFPGRAFILEASVAYDKKELLKHLPHGKANIQARNFPDSVESIRKKTGIKDGGSVYIFAATLSDNKKTMLVCRKI